jgi:hypothetical protein
MQQQQNRCAHRSRALTNSRTPLRECIDEAREIINVQHRRDGGLIAVRVVPYLLLVREPARRGKLVDEAGEVVDIEEGDHC